MKITAVKEPWKSYNLVHMQLSNKQCVSLNIVEQMFTMRMNQIVWSNLLQSSNYCVFREVLIYCQIYKSEWI